jgi:hypothetical protein
MVTRLGDKNFFGSGTISEDNDVYKPDLYLVISSSINMYLLIGIPLSMCNKVAKQNKEQRGTILVSSFP